MPNTTRMTVVICTFVLLLAGAVFAQDEEGTFHNAMPVASPPGPLPEPFRIGSPRNQSPTGSTPSAAAALYRQLRDIHLDPNKVYRIREASIEREDVHITLDDGMIAFTQAVDGRITGAFFEGEGEVLLIPPDRVERRSLGLFTDSAVLEEKFTFAFFRFNDNLAEELSEYLREHEEDSQAFVTKWDGVANRLSETDALRLLTSFLNSSAAVDGKMNPPEGDRMLRVRISGTKLGVFDLFFDTDAREQISVGQLARDQYGRSFFNVWTTFPMRSMRIKGSTRKAAGTSKTITPAALVSTHDEEPEDRLHIVDYKIKVAVQPPTDLDVECVMNAEVIHGGQRVILLELSRFLQVRTIEFDGKPLEFLQNEALEGTALARRGNDMVALIFPEKLQTGQKLQIRFLYGGSVMMDAGGGLLYVGARGIWYPNRGVSMANFDMQFTYPEEWTLVATGKRATTKTEAGTVTSSWISERPIPIAGFNLGHYMKAEEKLGTIPIEVYASRGVETNMAIADKAVVFPASPTPRRPGFAGDAHVVPLTPPAPSLNAALVAERVKKGLESLSQQLGPYPYDSLVLSQMPGRVSQGWPGLIFLSSYVFLTPEEMERSKIGPVDAIMYSTLMPIHEAAHQWWGDMLSWKSYRDQWLVEALANYCALVAIEKNQPREVQQVLNLYRRQLLHENSETKMIGADAGPVTLGVRLYSSHFPVGYEQISYGRGTWLFHMLRHMLRDAELKDARKDSKRVSAGDEPFFRVLRKICERYQGKFLNNHLVQQAFEEEVPESLRFDGRKSLDWFFDEWVNGTAIPKFETSNVKVATTGKGTVITGKILQKESPPELITSIPVYGVSAKGSVFLGRVFADGSETAFRLTAPSGTRRIELDPYDTVLRRKN